jgi:hypothetical protein
MLVWAGEPGEQGEHGEPGEQGSRGNVGSERTREFTRGAGCETKLGHFSIDICVILISYPQDTGMIPRHSSCTVGRNTRVVNMPGLVVHTGL